MGVSGTGRVEVGVKRKGVVKIRPAQKKTGDTV